jgi:NADH-quinone oxidoreductase subunit L/multicomponent Na+:H+ antiporter subunit D
MTDIISLRPALALLLPALGALAIVFSRHHPTVRESWTLLAAVGQVAVVASMVPGVLGGSTYITTLGTLVPGVAFGLRADALGVLFALVASVLWVITSVYNVGYTRQNNENHQTRYFASFATTLSAAAGVAFAPNLLVLFVFYELLTVATYPLVTHKGTDAARQAGRKYVGYTFGGGVLVFVGIVLVFWLTGSTAFTSGGIAALATADPVFARAAFAFLIAGFGVKAALMPLHSWLPDAMVAPTPVSGLLHAVAVVESGVFCIARVVLDIFGPETMHALDLGIPLAVVAAVTMLVASIFALKQRNLKRMLAYSTVSQLSYIVLGLAVVDPTALVGALFHIPAHAIMKLALFLCAGAIYSELHLESIEEMAGIGRRMPATMTVFTIAAMGMIGIPLTAGFVSKFSLVVGSLNAGYVLFAAVLVGNGLLKVGYLWPVVYQAFFETPAEHDPKPIFDSPIGGYWANSSDHHHVVSDGAGHGNHTAPGTNHTATVPVDDAHADTAHSSNHPIEPRSWRTETSPLLVGPLLVLGFLTILLGVAPGVVGVDDLVVHIVELATGVSV